MELKEIQEYVKKQLSEKRYNHSVGVMERSEELAKMYGADVEIAKKIGIAHDVAKEISEEDKLKYVKDNNIEIDEVERENTPLLHAKIGKDIAIKKFGFSESMGQAIANHTTGNKDMDIYSKILFIADRTSKERNFDDIEYIKDLAKKESCVIVGRCADYILKDNKDTIKVFLYSSSQDKVKRAVKYYNLEEDKILWK